ncbi:MAG: transglutaminase family protein [Candidatus Marinimicrobia bacterium]|nr:transglutaminase family protein [Candidatus Neomarinimicrobiota bacterium]
MFKRKNQKKKNTYEDAYLISIISTFLYLFLLFPATLYLGLRYTMIPIWVFSVLSIMVYFFSLYFIFFFRKLLAVLFYLLLLIFLYSGMFPGDYNNKIRQAYKSFLFPLPNNVDLISLADKNSLTRNLNKINDKIDYDSQEIRAFVYISSKKHNFNDYLDALNIHMYDKQADHYYIYQLIQSFAAFKEISHKWQYIYDPRGIDFNSKASETLKHFSGDCDDHAILMAACIKATDCKARLVRSHNTKRNTNHIYPEIFIGDQIFYNDIAGLIKTVLFDDEYNNKKLFYHKDDDGQIWLNMDYSEKYPGGHFIGDEILSITNL